jgi:hypothetical protein
VTTSRPPAAGTVQAIDLLSTKLSRSDNVQFILPNGKIWGQPVTNYSAHKTRRLLRDAKALLDDVNPPRRTRHRRTALRD